MRDSTGWRRARLVGAGLFVAVLAVDLAQPAQRQVTARCLIGGIHAYQKTASRWFAAAGVRCRMTPTCSRYGEVCLRRFGTLRGGWLALRRIARCGPWTPRGTFDPPPERAAADGAAAQPNDRPG